MAPDRFTHEVLKQEEPIVVLFDASWCPFCRSFRKLMERYASDLPRKVVIVSLDDLGDPLWERYNVEVVPTMAVFEKGKVIFRIDGILGVGMDEKDIARLRSHLESVD